MGEVHAHTFGTLIRLLKKCFKKKSVWFGVHCIKKIVPALELAMVCSTMQILLGTDRREICFSEESPGSRWHQPETQKTAGGGGKRRRRRKQTSITFLNS